MPRLLVVDDDVGIRTSLREFLGLRGFEVEEAGDARAAEQAFRSAPPDAVILDHQLPDGTALDVLPRLRQIDASVPVLVLTAHASINLAVQAVKLGAEQFLAKPIELTALHVVLERLIEGQRDRRSRIAGRTRRSRESVDPFLGKSGAIRALAEEARRVTASVSPILIAGETGSGKGVLARWLHANGPRAEEPFVDLNCAGLSREFLESDLFGHQRGAFTGAVAAKPGLLEIAHRGVAFLDERRLRAALLPRGDGNDGCALGRRSPGGGGRYASGAAPTLCLLPSRAPDASRPPYEAGGVARRFRWPSAAGRETSASLAPPRRDSGGTRKARRAP